MRLFTEAERVEVWDRRQAGEGNRSIGRRLGRSGVRSERLWNRRVEFGLPSGERHLDTCLLMSGRRFLVVWPRVSLPLLSAVVWDGPGQPSQGSWLVTVARTGIGRSALTGKRGRGADDPNSETGSKGNATSRGRGQTGHPLVSPADLWLVETHLS